MAAQGLQKKLPFQEKPHFNSPGIWIPELSPGKHQLRPLPAPKSPFVGKQSIIPFFDISDDKVQEQINAVPVPDGPQSRQGITAHRPKSCFSSQNTIKQIILLLHVHRTMHTHLRLIILVFNPFTSNSLT